MYATVFSIKEIVMVPYWAGVGWKRKKIVKGKMARFQFWLCYL